MAIDGFVLFLLYAAIAAIVGVVVLFIRAGRNVSGDPGTGKGNKMSSSQE
jgi:hypothetical protein